MMQSVRQHGTGPELTVRTVVHSLGARYRLQNRDLPGSPDLANRRRRWAIFVNGCFWHGHKNCGKTKSRRSPRVPRKNNDFWAQKLEDNRERDARKIRQLRGKGFRVAVIWECDLYDPETLRSRLSRFLRIES